MANILMLVLSLIVAGCMGAVLMWFFRRLNKIEEKYWGPKKKS